MKNTRDGLIAMMDYLIDHNQEHEQELREWAAKTSSSGEAVVQALLMAAANLAEASVCLERAKQALKEGSN